MAPKTAGYPYIHSGRGISNMTAVYVCALVLPAIVSAVMFPSAFALFLTAGSLGLLCGRFLCSALIKKKWSEDWGYQWFQLISILLLMRPASSLPLPFAAGFFLAVFPPICGGIRFSPLNAQAAFIVLAAFFNPAEFSGTDLSQTHFLWNPNTPILLLASPLSVLLGLAILLAGSGVKPASAALVLLPFTAVLFGVQAVNVSTLTLGAYVLLILTATDWASMPLLPRPRNVYLIAAGFISALLIQEACFIWAAGVLLLNAMSSWMDMASQPRRIS